MKKSILNIYPPTIILLIGGFIIFSVWSAIQAKGLGSKVIDAEYYSKGLKYNNTKVEKRAAEAMGWSLEPKLNGRNLEFHLTDRTGDKVTRATGTLYLAIPDTAENIHLPLQEVTSGNYLVSIDDSINGSIQARLEIEREGARLNRNLLLSLIR